MFHQPILGSILDKRSRLLPPQLRMGDVDEATMAQYADVRQLRV